MQKIVPHLWYDTEVKEAVKLYTSLFENSKILSETIIEDTPSGDAKIINFELDWQQFAGISAGPYFFNEAFSLIVNCDDQKEIDYYWDKLSAVPEAEQCGWVKDQFGVSWQIVPSNMDEILLSGTEDEIIRVTEAFLQMKKFDINALEQAKLGH